MKLTLRTLTFVLALPPALALTTPRSPVNTTTVATITPPSTSNLTTNNTVTPPSRYYLQTRVKGHGNEDKNGLYVSGYHTGAGENDVTLESIDGASIGFLNGTSQQFDYGTNFPWGMVMVDYDFYASTYLPSVRCFQRRTMLTRTHSLEWDFVAINAGYGSTGFFFNETGLQYDQDTDGFAGWLGKNLFLTSCTAGSSLQVQ